MLSYLNVVTGEYPVSFSILKGRMKNTSFSGRPESIGDYRLVKDGPVPKFDRDPQYISEGQPVFSNDQYVRNWLVNDYTQGQIEQLAANKHAAAAASVRSQRNALLADTDWMALSDNTMTPEWATYRQALRDITDHTNFPWLNDEDWPVKPE